MKAAAFLSVSIAVALAAGAALARPAMDDMNRVDRRLPNIAMVHGAERKPLSGAVGTVHTARGEVRSVDVRIGIVALKHEPVKSLNWPSMTMSFKVRDRQLLESLSVGQRVEFDFVRIDNNYYVTAVR